MFQGIHVQILNVVADYRFVCVVSDDMDTCVYECEDGNVCSLGRSFQAAECDCRCSTHASTRELYWTTRNVWSNANEHRIVSQRSSISAEYVICQLENSGSQRNSISDFIIGNAPPLSCCNFT